MSWPADQPQSFWLGALVVKSLPASAGDRHAQPLSREDPLEEDTATHSRILTWRIPWTEEPGGLQSIGSKSWTWLKRLSTPMHVSMFFYSIFPIKSLHLAQSTYLTILNFNSARSRVNLKVLYFWSSEEWISIISLKSSFLKPLKTLFII